MKTCAFTKSYRKRRVLELPELELPQGQITAVIGANGSGKSTFARILAGIEPADGNKPILPETAVGYMPQKSYAFRMSTRRNILLNGGDRARAAALMRALGIDGLARQRAKKLSGGETAKMALCRLLMGRYELLVLDEPTAAMDMESTLAAEELIRAAAREQGCSVLLITHSVQQARRLADRVLFLHQGKLRESGDAERVLYRPNEQETRRFLEFYGV
jgi:ABC-type multidrug transport system ATPase subunit